MKPNICLSVRAYAKMILHASKFSQRAVCGVLLGAEENGRVYVEDAIPLFHQGLGLSPMMNAALMQVDDYCHNNELQIVAYYQANELLSNTLPDTVACRVSDEIQEKFPHAALLMVENQKVTASADDLAVKVYKCHDGKWRVAEHSLSTLEGGMASVEVVAKLLRERGYADLVDFDSHLDDVRLDWLNPSVNSLISLSEKV
ncbi:ER membrane protein complex subunit 8-like [Sycon ciliatum]|uniref:ER membrane protein complex subunit 8-like n=1 Tax=Sycon ciliatum TaxID=27933 RepID=UPI0020AC1068|eukprot:scpid84041/ scgid34703/ Neighbor of COX4